MKLNSKAKNRILEKHPKDIAEALIKQIGKAASEFLAKLWTK